MSSYRKLARHMFFPMSVFVLSVLSFIIMAPSKASAAVALNPDPGGMIASGQRELLRNCDTLFATSPAYAYFFTQPGTSHIDIGSFEVGPSTPSVSIRMNWASAVCRPNSSVDMTTLQALPTTPGVTGLAPGFAHDYTSAGGPGNYNIPGTFRHSFSEFTYAPPGGFTTSGMYTVNVDLYRISRFRSGALLCVNPGSRAPANLLDFTACSRLTLTATFWVNVQPNAPTVTPQNTCRGLILSTTGTRVDIYGPAGVLGSVPGPGPSPEFILEGRVSSRTTVDLYGIGNGTTTAGNSHRPWVWIPPADCRSSFVVTPTGLVNLTTKEEPTIASFFGAATLSSGPPSVKNVAIRYYYYVVRGGTAVTIENLNRTTTLTSAGNRHERLDVDLRPYGLVAGDRVCSSVTVGPHRGVSNAEGDIITRDVEERTSEQCVDIVNMPYVSFYGGDVGVGGRFANQPNCASGTPQANIRTNMNTNNLGSGVEFAAFVTGTIGGFRTAKATPGDPPRELAFANTGAVGSAGLFGSVGCIKNYFENINLLTPEVSTTVNFNRSGNFYYTPPAGTPITLGGALGNGNRAGIYIDGDLIIDDNVIANESWNNISQIPALHVFVRGNIYIQSNVTTITGLFVAMPDGSGNRGRIITCATITRPVSAVSPENLYSQCGAASNTRLVVRGALEAAGIDYLRTAYSLRDAISGDEREAGTSKAAEVIELVPELLMVAPESIRKEDHNMHDFFTTLPPIL